MTDDDVSVTEQPDDDGFEGIAERFTHLEFLDLPEPVRDKIFKRFSRELRVSLVPAYRKSVFLSVTNSVTSTYLLLASGTDVTDANGQARISIAEILSTVKWDTPMHEGLHPYTSGHSGYPGVSATTIPWDPVAVGAPVTVVTGTGSAPVMYVTTNEGITDYRARGRWDISWFRPTPSTGEAAAGVLVTGFHPDGTPAATSTFGWQMTIELVFAHLPLR